MVLGYVEGSARITNDVTAIFLRPGRSGYRAHHAKSRFPRRHAPARRQLRRCRGQRSSVIWSRGRLILCERCGYGNTSFIPRSQVQSAGSLLKCNLSGKAESNASFLVLCRGSSGRPISDLGSFRNIVRMVVQTLSCAVSIAPAPQVPRPSAAMFQARKRLAPQARVGKDPDARS